ncbi:general odorant-binding protein 83a-like [Schistocerca gregaria]|uniref:general odorant-binding protein 83a-like n=1 Tax=Schistocerca gregaria TaxID=7010 RepID=UPI00211E8CE1|nr:general odorant-binding protein 83a-like [Schistocerca gregaria]
MWTPLRLSACAALLLLLVAAAQAWDVNMKLTGRIMDAAKEVDHKCRGSTGVPREMLHRYADGETVDDDDFKCYLKCIMIEFNSLSEDGVFVLEEELENIPPEIKEEGHRVVHSCKHINHDEACQTAYQIHQCYKQSDPELYSLVVRAFDATIDA